MKMRNVFSGANLPGEPGDFAITPNADGSALLRHMCPGHTKKMCGVAIVNGPPDHEKRLHGWDGNLDHPTITPSIGCDHAPRCGWHGHIIKGERTP